LPKERWLSIRNQLLLILYSRIKFITLPRFFDGSETTTWYINPIAKGKEYWVFDTQQQKQHLAFDHSRLATSLSKVLGKEVSPYQLSRQFRIQQGFFDFDICC
jgi:hypothetical protein